MLLSHKFIVLCEDHYNPLTLIRTLSLDGLKPIVVLAGKNPYLITASKYAGNIVRVETLEEGLEYIINTYGSESQKPFLFSCDDNTATLLDARYSELKDHFYFFNGGADKQIVQYMDKERILQAAEECGIGIPGSERVRLGELPSKVNYPVITKSIKSTVGGWKSDVFICQNEEELLEAYKHIKSDPVLIEEFIEKDNELCIDGISFNGGEVVYMPFKVNYIRFTNKAYGNYMTVEPFTDEKLKNKITELFRKTNFSGIFSIEFLITKSGDLKFLEINFRHSTWAQSSRCGGADLPLIWAKSQLTGRLDTDGLVLEQKPFTAMAELADFNDSVRHGNLSVLQWIKDFRKCPCTYIYDRSDKGPFIATIKNSIGLLVNKFLHRF